MPNFSRFNKAHQKYSFHPNSSEFVKKEAFEKIRANIEYLNFANDIKSIMITSSSPNEGKSTIAYNIALAIASSGKKTLLMDADMRIPVLHRNFGIVNDVGLSDAILTPDDYQQTIQSTEYENLDFMPAGATPPNPSILLSSKNMEIILANLQQDYEYIIIDTPPILAVSDAVSLCKNVNAVLFVAKKEVLL